MPTGKPACLSLSQPVAASLCRANLSRLLFLSNNTTFARLYSHPAFSDFPYLFPFVHVEIAHIAYCNFFLPVTRNHSTPAAQPQNRRSVFSTSTRRLPGTSRKTTTQTDNVTPRVRVYCDSMALTR